MAKFKVGDEVAVAAIMKIAAIQPQSNGTVSYSTDIGITIPEHLMEQIALSLKEQKVEETEPAPRPAHRFNVGEDVIVSKWGTGTVVGISDVTPFTYIVDVDNPRKQRMYFSEDRLSHAPAPEPPKFYTGKVFAEKIIERDAREGMRNRIGRVFEIKNGIIQGDVKQYDLDDYDPIVSFSDFCLKAKSTKWHEVKSDV